MSIESILKNTLRQIAVTKNYNNSDEKSYLTITSINNELSKHYQAIKNGNDVHIEPSEILDQLHTVLKLKHTPAAIMNSIMQSLQAKNTPLNKHYVLCLPHAGGSAQFYNRWIDETNDKYILVPIELPGHGSKTKSGYPVNLTHMLQLLCETITPYLSYEYSIFGHSFGAFLAYEITLLLQSADKPTPENLFLSACASPNQISLIGQYMNNLSDIDLWNLLFDLDGTDDSLRMIKGDFQKFYLNLLRSDLQLMANYEADMSRKVNAAVTVHTYSEDTELIRLSMSDWRHYCNGLFRLREFNGGHFSLLHSNEWLNDINKNIMREICDGSA